MALNKRDRIGVLIMVGLFAVFGVMLYFTIERPDGPSRSIQNNVIIEQRMKNLENRK